MVKVQLNFRNIVLASTFLFPAVIAFDLCFYHYLGGYSINFALFLSCTIQTMVELSVFFGGISVGKILMKKDELSPT